MFDKYQNYLEYYIDNIKPVINELDIALKCKSKLKNNEIAEILGISEEEIKKTRKKYNLEAINGESLVKIMQEGSSAICKIFQREMEIGSPFTYTREQLAYIYNFDADLVNDVCEDLNIKEITWQSMPVVFSSLPYTD